MTASIIVCTRNRCTALRETLHALELLEVPAGMRAEVIIVDNGSSDDTPAVVKAAVLSRLELKYVHEARMGKSNALNTGMDSSRGEILIFTDDDVRPEPNWLERITGPIMDHRFDALSGTVRIAPHLLRPWMSHMHLAWLASTHYLDASNPETAVGANMSFARKVLDRVPRFDPELGPGRLGLWEDTLFSLQLKRAGFRLGMAGDAIVEHHFEPCRLTRRSFLNHAKNVGRSDAYVAWHWKHQKHPAPKLAAANYHDQLLLKRALRWKDWHRAEGLPLWELNLLSGIAFCQQYSAERKRDRNYDRFGISKKL